MSAVGYQALALNTNDDVTFLLPATGSQPDAGDKLVYTGGRATTVDATGCQGQPGATAAPVQNSVLVDPGGGHSGRIVGVITVFQTGGGYDPVPPGTRISSIGNGVDCNIGTTAYKKYNGKVE